MNLTDYFKPEEVYCLTYDKRLARGDVTIFGEMERFGIIPNCFLAGDGKTLNLKYDYIDQFPPEASRPQAYNYANCFKQIIRRGIDQKLDKMFFLEDDATITGKFEQIFPLAMEEASKLPWDAIFVGGIHRNNVCWDIDGCKHLILPSYSLDLHAIIIKNSIFNNILSYGDCYHHTFDGAFTSLQKTKVILAINPSLIIQKPCYSYNSFRWEDKVWQYDDINRFLPVRGCLEFKKQ